MLKLNYSAFGSIKLQWEVKGEGGEGEGGGRRECPIWEDFCSGSKLRISGVKIEI